MGRHARSEFHHFVSQFAAGQSLSRHSAAQVSARQTTSLGDFTVAQLTHRQDPMCNFTLACHYLQLCHWILWNQKRRPTQFFSLSRIDGFFLKTWAPSSPQGRCLTGQLAGLHVCRKAQRTVRTSLQHGAGERAQCRAVGPVPTQQHLATCACHTRCSLASHLANLIETSAPLISS